MSVEMFAVAGPHASWPCHAVRARRDAVRRGLTAHSARLTIEALAEVVVSVTGGTTAMARVAERLGEDALGLGAPVRRIALIDRRPAAEKRREPYMLSDVVDLDGPG